ncbi:hypothetical protein B0H13DRAFT_670396 [Mycena leptocephala]|nr:hypothetical protein B0H13DRAFT_670396 [Mycena leptocephala]
MCSYPDSAYPRLSFHTLLLRLFPPPPAGTVRTARTTPQAAPPLPQLHIPRPRERSFVEEPSMPERASLSHDSVASCIVLLACAPPSPSIFRVLGHHHPRRRLRPHTPQTPPLPFSLSRRHGSVLFPHLRLCPHRAPSVSLVALSSSQSPTPHTWHSRSDTTSAVLAVAVPRFCAPSAGGASPQLRLHPRLHPRPCPWSSLPALLSQTPTPHWHWHSHSDLDTTSAVLTIPVRAPSSSLSREVLPSGLRSLFLSFVFRLADGLRDPAFWICRSILVARRLLSLITGRTTCGISSAIALAYAHTALEMTQPHRDAIRCDEGFPSLKPHHSLLAASAPCAARTVFVSGDVRDIACPRTA